MNRRLEFYITPQLRHQGFEAITIADLLPNTTTYSPKDLLRQMQRAKMDGVMQVTYRGEAPSNGTPQEVHFKYHSIKGRSPTLSTHPNPLDSALVELINGLARGETK